MRTITKNFLENKMSFDQLQEWADKGLISSEAYKEAATEKINNLVDKGLGKIVSMNVSQESF